MISLKNYIQSIGFLITFLLMGFLVNPFSLGFFLGYAVIALVLVKKKFLLHNMDSDFVLLLFLSSIYAVFYSFDPIGGVQFVMIYAIFPPVFYLLGKYLVRETTPPKMIFNILVIIGFSFSISAMTSVLSNFLEGGFLQVDRSIPMFWTGELVSATKMGAFFTLNMCIPALMIADQGKSKIIPRIVAGSIFILSLICVLRLGSRTQLGIMLITSFVSLFYVVPRQSFKKNTLLFMLLSVVAFLIYRNVSFDLNADWLNTFAGRMEKGTGDITSGGGRTERWSKSIEYMFKKPLGWSVKEFGFAHNLWLDVLRVSGVIPFVLLLIFSVRSFFKIKKTVRLNSSDLSFNVLILVYAIAFFLLFMVEPIFDGMFPLFIVFCLFMGTINKYRTMQPINS